jgi:hypothetical protein
MSLVPANGVYRRRLFLSSRRAARRAMALRLALVVTGACCVIGSFAVM